MIYAKVNNAMMIMLVLLVKYVPMISVLVNSLRMNNQVQSIALFFFSK